jgi:hypothetical protein
VLVGVTVGVGVGVGVEQTTVVLHLIDAVEAFESKDH